jgi:hypothetical protein
MIFSRATTLVNDNDYENDIEIEILQQRTPTILYVQPDPSPIQIEHWKYHPLS